MISSCKLCTRSEKEIRNGSPVSVVCLFAFAHQTAGKKKKKGERETSLNLNRLSSPLFLPLYIIHFAEDAFHEEPFPFKEDERRIGLLSVHIACE